MDTVKMWAEAVGVAVGAVLAMAGLMAGFLSLVHLAFYGGWH